MPKGIYKRTSEMNANNSKSKKGVPKTPEHCTALSAAKMGHEVSDETRKKISEHQRSNPQTGNDIVKHHFIYDHNNPENHVVEVTRSQHVAHHHWMKRNGLEVPHFNITEENKNIFNR